MTIRPYAPPGAAGPHGAGTPGDRAAVRELCCEAAYGDVPLESFYPDRALFADLSTRFYLDWEPASSWVAETDGSAGMDGRVVGYLLGAADSRRQRWVQITRVVPAALAGFVLRGGLAKGVTWRLLAANVRRLVPRGGSGRARFDPDRYPAHLHLGLDPAQRGRGLGGRLVETFLAQLRAAGVPGVHAVVLAENGRGGRFFERLGFSPLAESAALRRPGQPGEPTKIVYGRRL